MTDISKVIITGGHEVGGLQSFAVTLAEGFSELGIPAEVIPPMKIFRRWRDLRNNSVLKILSTTAVFAAPFARRSICMAHAFPAADVQGWIKSIAIVVSLKISGHCNHSSRLAAVSHYVASHIKAIYRIESDAVIHNPLNPIFFDAPEPHHERPYLTYVGRLHPVKQIDRIIPAMQSVLDEHPRLRARIIGDGLLREGLERQYAGDPRIIFTGAMDMLSVRNILRRTSVFVSGCTIEALGIAYLEALSQGCAVVMPACGGGLEIAPELLGNVVQIASLPFTVPEIQAAIEQALKFSGREVRLDSYRSKAVASDYLQLATTIG